ncbi:hypothetical protein G6F54_001168 [Rhizopus delemar]|nr:hypothetical protein G6F54_001168 [Rhizopus delemar]
MTVIEINGTYVRVYDNPPTALEFLRTSVQSNRPAIIKGAFDHWPARTAWSNEYLRTKMGKSTVTVAVTPNGYADAVTFDPVTQKEYFVMPHEQKMSFNSFLDIIEGKQQSQNANYISLQNGSLPVEYSALENDVDKDIAWCSEALGKKPDAVNFWFGDDKSITSLHKDPYENCYAVIRGQKEFILFPPSEYYCMHESVYQNAIYEPNKETNLLEIKPIDSSTPWIPVNPLCPDMDRFPRFKNACPIKVTVDEGDLLYLPALWFHQVLQKGQEGVIAINYWYDMDYSHILFPTMNLYRKLLTGVIENNHSHPPPIEYNVLFTQPPLLLRRNTSATVKRPNAFRKILQGAGLITLVTAGTVGIGGTVLYQNNDRFRHVVKALERCSVAGAVGAHVAYDYYRTLSKDYENELELEQAKSHCHQRSADRVLLAIQRLGGIYVKLGQHISVMQYILPSEWCQTMAILQDKCDSTPPEDIKALFMSDYGVPVEDIFEEFDWTPLGVASLAQVHRAKLKKGVVEDEEEQDRWVAVKLQHPYLDDYCKVDMETVSFIIEIVKKVFPEFGFGWLADEMRESLPKELDFVHEAENSQRVQANFYEDCIRKEFALVVPKVIWAKRRIMCMEFITGARIDDLDYMKHHNIDPNEVSKELTRVFSEMIFVHGFVHCDPHPGNVFVRPAKDPKHSKYNFDLVLLDHGLYRELSNELRSNYAHLWTSLIKGNEQGIRTYSYKVAGTEGYQLFACMLTGREWETINQSDLNSARTVQEVSRMTEGAIERIVEVADILGKLPRVVLLLLKTNDLLRHVDEKLSNTHDERMTYVIMGSYCSKAVWLDTKRHILEKVRTYGLSFHLLKELVKAWWQHESLAYSLWLYQLAAKWLEKLSLIDNNRKLIE